MPICSVVPGGQCPEAAPRRAKGAGLYSEGADRATLCPPPTVGEKAMAVIQCFSMNQPKSLKKKIDTIEKLAPVVVESFEEMRADQVW